VSRDRTENVGKWPLDESGKDPVNENDEKMPATVPLRDSAIAKPFVMAKQKREDALRTFART
jgi:hypothetical protein